ncbi:meiotic recombination protein W68 [Anopheles nili]|uniref:meiotic recombination protein W68 n=1 Tax=Anopheles nili TaxID=185578 RepID=UPI00237B6867|nr:meiotic recombination protein W68 [Anopheles nili]
MFVRSSNFFHDCENNHEWDSKTKSSISLPSSLSSISFSSSYNPTDSLLFSAPDWNKNLVQLFQEFNECVDSFHQDNSGNNEKKRTPDPLSNQTDSSQISERQRHILARIVDLLYLIEQSVDKAVPLTVRRKPRWNTCSMKDGILQLNDNAKRKKNIKPINTRRLQLIVRMLASIHQLLVTNSSCTKRELYYLHVELAQTPAYAYSTLDDICALLDVDAWEMNIFNTSKGLIAGPMMLKLNSGHTIDCNIRWGTSVPLDVGSVVDIQFSAKLVLVVEKDTVFKRLLQDGLLDKYPSTFVLITGKGYPDISTRLLLKKIADFSKAPIFGLMDADPHGIEIFCVYKYGALAMAHRQQSLAIPSMRWIGLFPSDIELLGLQGVALKEPELRRIGHIIKRPYTEDLIQRELLLLRQLGFKAEIESLYNIASDFLVSVYLKGKLKNFMYLLENTENIIQIVKYRYGKCPS